MGEMYAPVDKNDRRNMQRQSKYLAQLLSVQWEGGIFANKVKSWK